MKVSARKTMNDQSLFELKLSCPTQNLDCNFQGRLGHHHLLSDLQNQNTCIHTYISFFLRSRTRKNAITLRLMAKIIKAISLLMCKFSKTVLCLYFTTSPKRPCSRALRAVHHQIHWLQCPARIPVRKKVNPFSSAQ